MSGAVGTSVHVSGETGTCSSHENSSIKYGAGGYRLKAVARFPGGIVRVGKKHTESRKLKKLALCRVEL